MEKLVTVIAKEKMQLAKGIYASGVAIINIDQKELVLERKDVTARQITFGKSDKANLKILSVSANNKGFSMSISYQGQLYNLALKDVFPEHYAYSFAAAIAAAAAVGIPPSIAIQNLASYRAPAGRMRLFEGIKGSTILDSTYNASPDTMLESLKLLKNLAGRSRKIAVIGDMRELGLSEKIAHKNLADWLTMYSDEVILYGDLTRTHTLPVLLSKKFNVKHFTHMPGLIKYLESIIKPKSHILLKGSQNTIYLERAVEAILNNQHDVELLCRRGPYWDKIRKQSK